MATRWERFLERWQGAGVVDAPTAERIRAWEAEQESAVRVRWPVLIAWSLGAALVVSGILLFVGAHWDEISPAARFTLVVLMITALHVGGALAAARSNLLAVILHAAGTASLGAGIFLAGQIFHLEEHWPGGLMLWAAGAWMGWAIRRDWVQAWFAALLTPAWLIGEWTVAAPRYDTVMAHGLLLLSITYLTAVTQDKRDYLRRALALTGGLSIVPLVAYHVDQSWREWGSVPPPVDLSAGLWVTGWGVALVGPLAAAYWLRGRAAAWNLVTAVWVVGMGALKANEKYELLLILVLCAIGSTSLGLWGFAEKHRERVLVGAAGLMISYIGLLIWAQTEKVILVYLLCAVGAIGAVVWGVRRARREGINVGVACFALTVGFFYFSEVMGKLGRSASLIGMGLLFLAGGWALERTRRRLVAGIQRGES